MRAPTDSVLLVTGATGFLGARLCRRLLRRGAVVHGVSRRARGELPAGPRWWRCDLTDGARVLRLVREVAPDAIVHLSGLVTAEPDRRLVAPTLRSLLESTVNVLSAAAERPGCKVVLAASLTEPEAPDAAPASPYAAAKWASGAYGRMFHALYDVPVVAVRPFQTYGPGQDPRKLIPSVTLALLRREQPRLAGGTWRADWIYVDDVVDGFIAALSAPAATGCTLDLGTGRLTAVRDIVRLLVQLTGSDIVPRFGTLPDRPLERERAADTARTNAVLGWRAATALDDGLRRTIDWYRAAAPAFPGCGAARS